MKLRIAIIAALLAMVGLAAQAATLSGTGGDYQTYSAQWTVGTLRPGETYPLGDRTFLHFTLETQWPGPVGGVEWGVDKTTWSVTCSDGELSGIGGDGQRYSASWTGPATLQPIAYYDLGQSAQFIHFTLGGNNWPLSDGTWGILETSWSVKCADGVLSGIGGDYATYTEQWAGLGTLHPGPYYSFQDRPFLHFTLATPFPSADWGIDASSWSVTP